MDYKTLNEYQEETHPWEPYIPSRANKLILGTFPTTEKYRISYPFFYPSPNNNFWRVLMEVAGQDWDDFAGGDPITLRKKLLSDLRLGISDIGYRILRQLGSAKDQNLFPIEYKNISKYWTIILILKRSS